jgi:hypothetical protein
VLKHAEALLVQISGFEVERLGFGVKDIGSEV